MNDFHVLFVYSTAILTSPPFSRQRQQCCPWSQPGTADGAACQPNAPAAATTRGIQVRAVAVRCSGRGVLQIVSIQFRPTGELQRIESNTRNRPAMIEDVGADHGYLDVLEPKVWPAYLRKKRLEGKGHITSGASRDTTRFPRASGLSESRLLAHKLSDSVYQV
jgi:hypothetical protein